MTNLDSKLKSRDITLSTKVHLFKAMVFPVVMYGYENWTIKKAEPKYWCFWTVVLEKTLESPLGHKEIKPVHSKGNQPWVFIGRTDAEAESPLATWCVEPTHWKRPRCWERLKAGREGAPEGEMVGWHHWLNGHEFEPTPGDSEEPGSLGCWSPWSKRVRHDWVTE